MVCENIGMIIVNTIKTDLKVCIQSLSLLVFVSMNII